MTATTRVWPGVQRGHAGVDVREGSGQAGVDVREGGRPREVLRTWSSGVRDRDGLGRRRVRGERDGERARRDGCDGGRERGSVEVSCHRDVPTRRPGDDDPSAGVEAHRVRCVVTAEIGLDLAIVPERLIKSLAVALEACHHKVVPRASKHPSSRDDLVVGLNRHRRRDLHFCVEVGFGEASKAERRVQRAIGRKAPRDEEEVIDGDFKRLPCDDDALCGIERHRAGRIRPALLSPPLSRGRRYRTWGRGYRRRCSAPASSRSCCHRTRKSSRRRR